MRLAGRAISGSAVSIACIVYIVGYAGYSLFDHPPEVSESGGFASIRYLVYIAPLILVVPLFFQRTPRMNMPAFAYFLGYLALGFIGYLEGIKDTGYFLADFGIIAFGIACFVPEISVGIEHIRLVFFVSLAYFAFAYFTSSSQDIRLFQILESGTGSGLENGYDNHQGGLVGPIYSVFFFAVGAKFEFFLALLMSLLGGKRIGMMAILVGISTVFLLRHIAARKMKLSRFAVLLASLAVINVVGTHLIPISEYVYRSLNMNVHIEAVMLGRYKIGSELTHDIDERPMVESLIGYGAGNANELATELTKGSLVLPHNDWLKILYDYGILGSILITFFIALVFSSSTTAAAVALTNAIIMTTDNVTIYLYYQFPIALMVAYSITQKFNASGTTDVREAKLVEAD
jgi:O-Antigen ligase